MLLLTIYSCSKRSLGGKNEEHYSFAWPHLHSCPHKHQLVLKQQPLHSPMILNKVIRNSFKDIAGHWAESSIVQAVKRGYVDGYPDGNFLPNNKVSRAEFVKMLASALALDVGTASGNWDTPYVNAAQTAGIYKAGDFNDALVSNTTRSPWVK
ncbi:S-layer homology domain-containing protein [Paenibacillus naphthalenovorans]|uniref:S-layer homology domain-containing protein n=1 Tax=Paenibacillus naphthalenovorans TaxID=162209 RepID=UPI000881453B|nr:S-layer homology domain-containing protein [Paenibacillus naphthalenovorans]SDI62694.1 S-layer homology domain-containing protein [Paenibacillus naphthalenovorans]